jgi:hypothetical protein
MEEDGEPIAEDKRDVDGSVEELLGLEHEQFRQVVALPQGHILRQVFRRSVPHGPFSTSRDQPGRSNLLDTYLYNQCPYADLQKIRPQSYSLDGLCGLLGVPSPK